MNPLSTGDPLRLGPYRLIGVLGAGGMGKVYLGREGNGHTAAVKVLHAELAHDQNLSLRFVREAQTAQAVESRGVARVLGAWTEGGRPWIATEFLAGPTLNQAVARYGPFDDPGVRVLGAALARTLQDIHAAGLVHRDLKPSNIVLTSTGPRIIDFGIARPEHGLTLTATGQVPVTPGYGSPEQVLGQRVGPPADVFSLGAVLAYAGSGRRAYDGAHVAAVQYEVVDGEPDLDSVPELIRALIAPCLAKDPSYRPLPAQIAAAFAPPRGSGRIWRRGPLATEISQREVEARKLATFPDTRVPGAPSRRLLLTAFAGGGTLVAAAGATGAWWLLGKGSEQGDGESKPPTNPWDAKRLTGSQYEEGTAPPPLWGPLTGPAPMAVAPLVVRDIVVVQHSEGLTTGCRVTDGQTKWSFKGANLGRYVAPTDDLIVTVADLGTLVALNSSTGAERWRADTKASPVVVVAADTQTVYFTCGGMGKAEELRAFDVSSRSTRWSIRMPVMSSGTSPASAAVGSGRLVLFGADGNVVTVDTRTGEEVWKLPKQGPEMAVDAPTPAISDGIVYLGGRTLTARKVSNGDQVWSVPAKTELGAVAGGWGPPTIEGDTLYALDGAELSRRSKRGNQVDWTRSLGDDLTPPCIPPVVQGKTVWVILNLIGRNGVMALHKDSGKPAWTYARGGGDPWNMRGASNRVFLVHEGTLTAMPVF
ncbi:serine/threonine-protein kinase [Streptomyces sp. ISL-11]|uniref:serine/threonine-protein kinase n=1 Tax=Streptomyces sp. ISL-11 TaxID=2819174 RepID=UPI001BE8CF9C|nr:serine/threonine-protein kinase [Streptomyces sp. ISL-11]MBT2385239.1 serine/threonine-protein kinase [Streptomyces sp. ISL-11]